MEGDHVARKTTPSEDAKVVFRDGDKIRALCPFFDVWARFDDDDFFGPLTASLLEDNGLSVSDVSWNVRVGNLKAFRRTAQILGRIYCLKAADTKSLTG